MHKNSVRLFEKYAAEHIRPGMRVLEIGPDRTPSTYQRMAGTGTAAWDTLDFADRPNVDLTYRTRSDYEFPVASESYDVVVSGQVIEHVRKVWKWMPEVARTCKKGGVVITINPVTWQYHEAPVDCWRIYPEGMKALYEDAGLDVMLSRWESVGLERYKKFVPDVFDRVLVFPRLSGFVGLVSLATKLPVEASYDTITIGRRT